MVIATGEQLICADRLKLYTLSSQSSVVILIVAVRAPTEFAFMLTVMFAEVPAASVAGNVIPLTEKSAAFVPVKLMLLMFNGPVPVFSIVNDLLTALPKIAEPILVKFAVDKAVVPS